MLKATFPSSHFEDVVTYAKGRVTAFMDFEASQSVWPLRATQTGTGASGSSGVAGDAGSIGVVETSTGTTATGSGTLISATDMFILGQGAAKTEVRQRVVVLSDAVERFVCRFGFIDGVTIDAADGVYFEYDDSVSANWQICTANNSVRTKVATGTVVDTNFRRLRVEVNSSGTSARFFIDAAEVSGSPLTTNIPTGAGRHTGVGLHQVKSVGITARTWERDYMWYDLVLDTPRA